MDLYLYNFTVSLFLMNRMELKVKFNG